MANIIVDDAAFMRLMVKDTLKEKKMDIRILRGSRRGAEALSYTKEIKPDLGNDG